MDAIEIYYENLDEETKQKVLNLYGLDSPADGNFDISPLAILEYGD